MACTFGVVALLIVTIAVGIAAEGANISKARSTLSYFALDPVCALNYSSQGKERTPIYSTFANRTQALAANRTIVHCGPCGHCSNDEDIGVYRATAQTLTTSATQCALKILAGGRASATWRATQWLAHRAHD
jgi:hypothetical protein